MFAGGVMLTWPLKQRWFWMLFFFFLAVILIPVLLVGFIFALGPSYFILILVLLVVIWYVFRSYRDWKASRQKEADENTSGSGVVDE